MACEGEWVEKPGLASGLPVQLFPKSTRAALGAAFLTGALTSGTFPGTHSTTLSDAVGSTPQPERLTEIISILHIKELRPGMVLKPSCP